MEVTVKVTVITAVAFSSPSKSVNFSEHAHHTDTGIFLDAHYMSEPESLRLFGGGE